MRRLTYYCSRKSARADNATVLARIDEVQQLGSGLGTSQEKLFKLLQGQRTANEKQAEQQLQSLDEVNQQLVAQGKRGRNILAVAKDVLCSVHEVKNLLVQVSQSVIDFQIIASNSLFIHLPDPTRELPVVLEDALGRQLEIPAQWVDVLEWEASPRQTPSNPW